MHSDSYESKDSQEDAKNSSNKDPETFYCKVSKSGQTVYIKPPNVGTKPKQATNELVKIPKQPRSKAIAKVMACKPKVVSRRDDTPLLGKAITVKDLLREASPVKRCRSSATSPTKQNALGLVDRNL